VGLHAPGRRLFYMYRRCVSVCLSCVYKRARS
jgi:hypothetical protein